MEERDDPGTEATDRAPCSRVAPHAPRRSCRLHDRSRSNLYVAADADGDLFDWLPIGGFATSGPFGLGGGNSADTAARRVFGNAGITFRALYDGTPSSVTLSAGTNSNWPTLPTVTSPSAEGFWLSGTSSTIAAGLSAWVRGSYTVTY